MTETTVSEPDLVPSEVVAIEALRPHPRNYNLHPEEQIEHLVESLREYGQFRNIVVARDDTILAGHGVVEAASAAGWTTVEVKRLDLDPDEPAALKLVALDNEIGRFAGRDDRLLSELLRDVRDRAPGGLLGTGYDDAMLANLVMVTRPAHEIASVYDAMQWVGMPGFEPPELADKWRLMIWCDDVESRDELAQRIGLIITRGRESRIASGWWPPREREDPGSVLVDG